MLSALLIRIRPALYTALFAVVLAVPAFAQRRGDEEVLPPYDVAGLEYGGRWIPWVFAFLFIALVVLAGIKQPHRNVIDRD